MHREGRPTHAVAMNKLFATWHHPADLDLDAGLDAADLLALACHRLADIPELTYALQHVGIALAEVSAWFDRRDSASLVSAVAIVEES